MFVTLIDEENKGESALVFFMTDEPMLFETVQEMKEFWEKAMIVQPNYQLVKGWLRFIRQINLPPMQPGVWGYGLGTSSPSFMDAMARNDRKSIFSLGGYLFQGEEARMLQSLSYPLFP